MNDFLDHIANHQYQKVHDRVEVKECKNSKLKEVYKKYLSILNEEEEDITICYQESRRISEKDLIKLLESRINGKPYKFPEGYITCGQYNSRFE